MYSVSNIRRRFGLLFTLPSTPLNLVLLLAASSPIPAVTYLSRRVDTLSAAAGLLGFEAFLFASLLIERYILRRSPLATFRRLVFTSFMSNSIWLTVMAIGLLYLNEPSQILILGAFYATAFRLLIFRSVFLKRTSAALAASSLQPTLLTLSLTLGSALSDGLTAKPSIYIGGSILVVSVLVYLKIVNNSGEALLKTSALTMFQAFLEAWSSDQPESLEDVMKMSGSDISVRTSLIILGMGGSRSALVVPEVHPGPFYPVGSSNLPFQIYEHLLQRGLRPLVLHGISGHELNLTSKKDVERLLKSLDELVELGGGDKCTRPLTVSFGRAVAHGMAFGEYAFVTLTLSDGMEDLPIKVKTSMQESALRLGFKYILLVDSHNSQGSFVGDEECFELLAAGEELLKRLKGAEQHLFKAGYSHSSELGLKFNRDIGPAGIAVLALDVGGEKRLLVSVDANNARKGVREEIISCFEDSGIPVLELCTSDTHITAGKIMTVNGYVALGDETRVDHIVGIVKELSKRAVSRLSDSKFYVKYADTNVKIVGEDMLNHLSDAIDMVTAAAKRGGIILLAVSLAAALLAYAL